jgi:LCP family protein required for cell wall assembly
VLIVDSEEKMVLRKFYFTVSIIVSIMLFFFGTYILFYINSMSSIETFNAISPSNMFGNLLKPFIFGKDPFNSIVLVGDKTESNTDTMLLVNFDPSQSKLSVMSIPRDTRVNISDMSIPKINGVFARKNGAKLLLDTASDLLNVKIKYYVYLNISTFRQIIDLLDGIDYYVPIDMDYDDPTQNLHIHLKKGQQRLGGEKAEHFLRFRQPNGPYSQEMLKYYDGSDLKRIEAQQNFLKEAIRQKANIIYLPKLNEIINVVYNNLETNITLPEVFKLSRGITGFSLDNVNFFTLPGESKVINNIWYYIYDKAETEKIISEYFVSKDGYTNIDSETKKNKSTIPPESKTDSKPKPVPIVDENKKDAIKDNPSNSDTSIKGSPIPEP